MVSVLSRFVGLLFNPKTSGLLTFVNDRGACNMIFFYFSLVTMLILFCWMVIEFSKIIKEKKNHMKCLACRNLAGGLDEVQRIKYKLDRNDGISGK